MSLCKSLENDVLSKTTIINRRKAIESILFETNVKTGAIKNIIESVCQSSLAMVEAQSKINSLPITVYEIYKGLEGYYLKGQLPVVLAIIVKNNMDDIVIRELTYKDG